jgi:oxygen-independent coproporphyrinogen-3 oxidase
MPREPLALYIHVPFCETKCPYCDFNTYAAIESLMPGYVDALTHEVTQWGSWLGKPELSGLFFGGGTPSYLPTRDIRRMMQAVRTAFVLPDDVEATLEANPGDCSRERLQAVRRAGINRLSIGVQSLDDNELRLLGRRHSAEQAIAAVDAARQAGFDNLSVDLMFGLPNQFVSSWEHTVHEAIALEPEHVSAYALTLEGGTPMEADVARGRLPEPDSDLAAEMYLLAQRALAAAGYEQYEISNWAKPGRASTHNLTYWNNAQFLGVGPGAHSYLVPEAEATSHGLRFATVKPPRMYIEQAKAWQADGPLTAETIASAGAVDTVEALTEAMEAADTMMMGLRLNDGVTDTSFRARFGVGIADRFPDAVSECISLGLLEWAGDSLRLKEETRLLGNEAFLRFVATA